MNKNVLRMSLHQAHILLNNYVADLTIPFINELFELIIIMIKFTRTPRVHLVAIC